MKKWMTIVISLLLVGGTTACSQTKEPSSASETEVQLPVQMQTSDVVIDEESSEQSQAIVEAVPDASVSDKEENESMNKQMSIQAEDGDMLVFELNDSTAASSFYEQLPMMIEIKDFSTNEKIFYPPEKLDLTDAPIAEMEIGTLAYYAPWGDIVIFYDEYNPNGDLYELGHIVSGFENIETLNGQLQISKMD